MGERAYELARPAVFSGGARGQWRVVGITAIAGPSLAPVAALAIDSSQAETLWQLRGFTSNARYTSRAERDALAAVQADLGRPEATHAALIPIRKSAAWWAVAQDERRAIFEERSHHIADTLRFLPAIARRLHHARDLGEPFDFLTWFEFAPEHARDFDELVRLLRATEEWKWVEREVDVRLIRQ